MAANVAVTYTYVNGTAADGTQVNQNFTDIVNWVNTNAVHLDGSKPFTGAPSYAADPVSANQLCRKSYTDGYLGGAVLSTVKLRRAAVQSMPNGISSIVWDTEDADASGFIVVSSSSITVPVGHGGFYVFYGTSTWASDPSTSTAFYPEFGASKYVGSWSVTTSASGTSRNVAGYLYLPAGQTFTMNCNNSTGGAVNVTASFVLRRLCD